MEPVLLGRTVRFHPCLQGKHRGVTNRHEPVRTDAVRPTGPGQEPSSVALENGSDFPTGKPLPWGAGVHLPQCTPRAVLLSTSRQYSCCGERGPRQHRAARGCRAPPPAT